MDKPTHKPCMSVGQIGEKISPLDNFGSFPQSMKNLFRTLSTGCTERLHSAS